MQVLSNVGGDEGGETREGGTRMRVALYARVSSEKQDTDLSISAQLRALRDWAARNGCFIVKEYVDEAESGRSIDRPGFKQMIGASRQKSRPFDAILVWKLSRFARSRQDSIIYKSLLRKQGIQVISINEPVEDTPSGRLLEGIIEVIDEFYSANLGQEVLRGMRECASRGFYVASNTPYGYQRVKVSDGSKERPKLEAHPHHAPVAAGIFREFLAGAGLKDIARALNSEGILAPRGKRWGKTTLHKILINEAYTGTLVWGHTSKSSQKVPPVRVEDAWEPIVDRETFNRVQSLLRERAPVHLHPRRAHSHYLLSGLARCGHCGKALVCQEAKSGQFSYYICNTLLKQGAGTCQAPYLNSRKFEKVVIDKIKERILTEENLHELVRLVNEEIDTAASETRQRLETVMAEIADVHRRLGRLYDALETGKLTLNDLAPRIQALRQQEDQLQAARLNLEYLLADRGIQLADEEVVRSYVDDLREVLANSSIPEQKAFIRSFVKEVRVSGKEVVLTYTIPLPPEGTLQEPAAVLDTVHYGGAGGTRTPTALAT
ncbi:recombinase family protein [Chloroflexota bacterium]